MSTFGGASQRQGGKSNHMFRPPINIVSGTPQTGTTFQQIQFTWQNLTRQAGFGVQINFLGSILNTGTVTQINDNRFASIIDANVNTTWNFTTYQNADTTRQTKSAPTISFVLPPYIPSLQPPGWTSPNTYFQQEGYVYNGGGQTQITYAAMTGSVTYNILKNGASYLTNVSMPYALTHTGANGVLATYALQAVGSAGATSTRTWQIQPYNPTGGQYVSASSGPLYDGDQQGYVDIYNGNVGVFPNGQWTSTVTATLLGNCTSCGCEQVLTTLFAQTISAFAYSNTVYLNTFYYRGTSSDQAYFNNTYWLITDKYYNGVALEPSLYGAFGFYYLYSTC
jgi:hypothetical protein